MGSLNEYKTLAEKEQFYNCIRIETEQEFDNYFNQIQTNSNGYAFRSINEAKFKLYSSAQRQWIWNDLSNAHTSFNNYILSLISQIQQIVILPLFLVPIKFQQMTLLSWHCYNIIANLHH